MDYEALATATIRGDYGNGEARRAALGASYGPVMRIVNQRLNGSTAYIRARRFHSKCERDRAQWRHHVRHCKTNRPVAVVRVERAVRQHQPNLSGQHRHLPGHGNLCFQWIRSHGRPRACRQERRNLGRHFRSQRLASRRPTEQPRQPQFYLLRPAAPLLTATTVASGTMPEATSITNPRRNLWIFPPQQPSRPGSWR